VKSGVFTETRFPGWEGGEKKKKGKLLGKGSSLPKGNETRTTERPLTAMGGRGDGVDQLIGNNPGEDQG